jgi:hypothetical protein
VLVRSAGRITSVNYPQSKIYDAYGDLSNVDAYTGTADTSKRTKIYNMDAAGVATIAGMASYPNQATNYVTGGTYNRAELQFTIEDPVPAQPFLPGDRYGLAVYQSQKLPRGFSSVVDGTPPTAVNMLKAIFEPDGRRGANSIQDIVVYETIKGNVQHHRVTFTIGSNGSIAVKRN